MAIGLEDKKAIVASVNETATNALSLVIADARGVTVGKMDTLRKQARANGVQLQVIRNTLAKRAAQGTSVEKIADSFKGPVVLILGKDPVTPAKVISDFAKGKDDKFQLKVAVVEGTKIDAKGIENLAKMPGLHELRGMIAGMLNAPAGKLARLIGTPGSQLARAIDARREQLEKAS